LLSAGTPLSETVYVTLAWVGLASVTFDTVADVWLISGELACAARLAWNAGAFCSNARREAIGALPLKKVTKAFVTEAVVAASAGEALAALGVGLAVDDAGAGVVADFECFELPQPAIAAMRQLLRPSARTDRASVRGMVAVLPGGDIAIKVAHAGG
jgi:hypothetical protein